MILVWLSYTALKKSISELCFYMPEYRIWLFKNYTILLQCGDSWMKLYNVVKDQKYNLLVQFLAWCTLLEIALPSYISGLWPRCRLSFENHHTAGG